jgi:hypothetical protein
MVLGDRLQDPGRPADSVVLDVLEPQLQTGDIAAVERRLKLAGESVGVERGWRDQVEPGRLRRRNALSGVGRDQSFP